MLRFRLPIVLLRLLVLPRRWLPLIREAPLRLPLIREAPLRLPLIREAPLWLLPVRLPLLGLPLIGQPPVRPALRSLARH